MLRGSLLLSVYSPFFDGIGLPLHSIPSPFFLSWTSLSILSSTISVSTLSNYVLPVLPTGLLFLITCPYHLSLPLLMTVVIGSTPTSLLNSSLVIRDPGMSLNCAPTRVCRKSASRPEVCRKSASRPGYVVKVRTDPGYVVKQCPRIVMNKIFDWH